MQTFIGTKLIKAQPMLLGAYNAVRGWDMPADEDPNTPGYLVEYLDGGKPNHPDHAGYISWSPADVFENAYRPSEGMSFSQALEALKAARQITRDGLCIISMHVGSASENARKDTESGKDGLWMNRGREATHGAYCFSISDLAGNTTYGWQPSLDDLMADTWRILP